MGIEAAAPEATKPASAPLFHMALVELRFQLKASDEVSPNKAAVLDAIMKIIKENNMAPYYEFLAADANVPLDQALLASMKAANVSKLEALEAQLADVTQNAGSVEIRDALYAIAAHYSSIGDKERAVEAFAVAYEKSVGVGSRLDVIFDVIRLAFMFGDLKLIKLKVDEAHKVLDEGGDWDRRNRLKVYEAVFLVCTRSFASASSLFLDTLATFTSTELLSTSSFIRYAVLTSLVSRDRVTLKTKVIDAPEVIEALAGSGPSGREDVAALAELLNALYECRYGEVFGALAHVEQVMKRDPWMSRHYVFVTREIRIRAYAQLLESYKSVTVDSMAAKFRVSRAFLDAELSRYIADQRLNCVIDAVSGSIVTNRPDKRNAQYQAAIKQGDLLLNRVQKLSRVMNL